ncbi:MAG: hypothetical protein QMB32_04880, partial [Burkholderiaceae bacterium]
MKIVNHWLGKVMAMLGMGAAATQAVAQDMGMDETINAAVAPVSNAIASFIFYAVPVRGTSFPLIVGWLVVAGWVC